MLLAFSFLILSKRSAESALIFISKFLLDEISYKSFIISSNFINSNKFFREKVSFSISIFVFSNFTSLENVLSSS